MYGSYSKLPSGNIKPSRFVVLQADGTVQQAGANADCWGIAQPSVRNLALAGWDDGYAGVAGGPPINIYGPGDDEAPLVISATVTAGQLLKSDANGEGTPVTTNGDLACARAVISGIAGDVIPVKPVRFDVGANAPI